MQIKNSFRRSYFIFMCSFQLIVLGYWQSCPCSVHADHDDTPFYWLNILSASWKCLVYALKFFSNEKAPGGNLFSAKTLRNVVQVVVVKVIVSISYSHEHRVRNQKHPCTHSLSYFFLLSGKRNQYLQGRKTEKWIKSKSFQWSSFCYCCLYRYVSRLQIFTRFLYSQ